MYDNICTMDIKELRKQLGWTQAQLANEMKVTQMTIRRWERNKVKPHLVYRLHLKSLEKKANKNEG